jgi:hypothetical protein
VYAKPMALSVRISLDRFCPGCRQSLPRFAKMVPAQSIVDVRLKFAQSRDRVLLETGVTVPIVSVAGRVHSPTMAYVSRGAPRLDRIAMAHFSAPVEATLERPN